MKALRVVEGLSWKGCPGCRHFRAGLGGVKKTFYLYKAGERLGMCQVGGIREGGGPGFVPSLLGRRR